VCLKFQHIHYLLWCALSPFLSLYINIIYPRWSMDPLVHHLDLATRKLIEPGTHPTNPCACRREPTASVHSDRADRLCAPPQPYTTQPFFGLLSHFAKASVIFWFHSVILLQHRFFATVNSIFLLQWSVISWFCQPFCYGELSHFTTVNSIICYSKLKLFFLQCSVILQFYQPFYYSELNHFCYSA
jgi:hypothetical protein